MRQNASAAITAFSHGRLFQSKMGSALTLGRFSSLLCWCSHDSNFNDLSVLIIPKKWGAVKAKINSNHNKTKVIIAEKLSLDNIFKLCYYTLLIIKLNKYKKAA